MPIGIIKNFNVIINGKNFYDQAIDSDIKRYKKKKKITRKGEDYTFVSLLDYGYIKKYYRLIAVDLSRQKELDDPKAIQQIDDGNNATDADNDPSMFVLTILEKIKETRLEFSQESVTVL